MLTAHSAVTRCFAWRVAAHQGSAVVGTMIGAKIAPYPQSNTPHLGFMCLADSSGRISHLRWRRITLLPREAPRAGDK